MAYPNTSPFFLTSENDSEYNISSTYPPKTESQLPPGFYQVSYNEGRNEYFLTKVKQFISIKEHLFGKIEMYKNRIINTFLDRKNKNTGVLLHGQKGCGKSTLIKEIGVTCYELGIPVITIGTSGYDDENFFKFLNKLNEMTPLCIIIDEFDKKYPEKEDQINFLGFLDGENTNTKMIITSLNRKKYLLEYLINRPGRFFYNIEFNTVPVETIHEICDKNGISKENKLNILYVSQILGTINFDILQSLIDEIKRYPNIPFVELIKDMNIKFDRDSISSLRDNFEINGKLIEYNDFVTSINNEDIHPLSEDEISIRFKHKWFDGIEIVEDKNFKKRDENDIDSYDEDYDYEFKLILKKEHIIEKENKVIYEAKQNGNTFRLIYEYKPYDSSKEDLSEILRNFQLSNKDIK